MRAEFAKAVFPVLSYGIRLKESVLAGDRPDLQNAQKELLALLQPVAKLQKFAEMPDNRSMTSSSSGGVQADSRFLGARYALVAWLDELFIVDSPWKAEWTEHILEYPAFRSRDRAWKFWEQARMAETQSSTDSLEVYYLCVMLGFRGDYDETPEKLHAWVDSARTLLDKGQAEWDGPVDSQPVTYVPPLVGSARLSRAATILGVALLGLIPVGMYLLFKHFQQP